MLAVYNGSRAADGITEVESISEFTNLYRHLTNCDLDTDVLLAETDQGIVGYARVTWWVESANSDRVLLSIFYLLPAARGMGAAEQMLHWTEARLIEVAAERPYSGRQFFTAYLDEAEEERGAVLSSAGYVRTQTYAEMVRSLSEPIPDHLLPETVEIRPVTWDDGRALWEADDRAFRDHVGYSPQTEVDYDRWRNFEHADPALWKVAFVKGSDAIAGQVLNYLNVAQNTTFGRSWGWTENISVQREWRKQGVARSLIAESMRMFQAMGMTDVALGVHTTNPNGAFPLYEGLGYRVTTLSYELRKPFVGDAG